MIVHGIIFTDNTYSEFNQTVNRGTGAHRIASFLRTHGYNIEVVDYCLSWTMEEFQELCSKVVTKDTLFLGIGSNLFYDRESFNDLIRWFKMHYPNVSVILGGNNTLGRDIPNIDYLIDGYAEQAMLALLGYLRGDITRDQVKWTNGNFINSYESYSHVDTSDLTIEYLPSDFINTDQVLGLETARGCIFKCTFCTYPFLGKKKFDYLRDPSTVDAELRRNYDKWGTTRYIITEDTFNDSVEKLEMLEQVITKLPFRFEFTCYGRLDLILAKPHSAELLRNMGMRGVHFGIETFNQNAAKIIRKGKQTSQLKEGLVWWTEQMPQVSTSCSLILGLPGDTDDQYANVEWLKTSGVSHWYWAPLYINQLHHTVHPSEFSRTFRDYGLVEMSPDEVAVEEEIERQCGVMNTRGQNFLNKTHRDRIVYWKNPSTGDNYFKSVRLSVELNKLSQTRRLSPWIQFDWVALGYKIEEMRKWGWYDVVPKVPMNDIAERATQFVGQYKANKINFNYQEFYNRDPKIKKIIQIFN